MVGKIKRVRQKLHQVAVRVGASGEEKPPVQDYQAPSADELPGSGGWSAQVGGKDWTFLSSNIFSTTKIDPQLLTQKLEVDTQSVVSAKKVKILVPKKEKAKLRRQQWLQKIETLALAHQAEKAQAKRKATPVVGDMRPLADALPELSGLVTVCKPRAPRKQPKDNVKKKPEPTDYCKMRPAQKRRIVEEEVVRVQELIKDPSYKANPLAAVGEQLRKRMKQEQEGTPS
ncbi:ribosome biogenesis protein SLX9 homolog isoform X2 [Bombina bombina]|uniref:ribosome biogenesis protein SLX9 homolog isoform X2 n=1 Tax=Bombina bombina TaxID=8345 RepID=UPI00235AB077|nr:ribosome biogenesis protein SLX9 homolog isoform X2 [Bombina bombina]